MADYIHAEVLVTPEWVTQHGKDPNVRVVEVDVDNAAYEEGHVPGALAWAWRSQLCDTLVRDIPSKQQFEKLMNDTGIGNGTTVVIYGDSNNWFAAWAFWEMKIYGHSDVRLMNGGRKKWISEGHDLETGKTEPKPAQGYHASEPDLSIRALLPQVQEAYKNGSAVMIDVRSPQEFSGEILAPPGLPETCQRGGHIPGAHSVPWSRACNDDGTFRTYAELKALYGAAGVDANRPAISYCRIGERSSHTWFVLKYLLGVEDVKNYDGSWTEWGNLVGAPVERGASAAAQA